MPAIFSKEKSSNGKSKNLKRLLPIQCLTPSKVKDDEEDDETESLLKTKYFELPKQQFFKISVLKLDGSVFDVFVKRNATVAELKVAVEEVFSSSPKEEERERIISWSHVWGHFCLCYNGKKLVNDKACVRNFGIKDGDQIRFIRHLSINYLHSKTRSKSQIVPHKPCLMLTSGSSRSDWKENKVMVCSNGITKENLDHSQFEDEGEEIRVAQFKLAHLLKGWLSYTRLWGGSGSKKEPEGGKYLPTRFATQSLRA